MQSNPSDPIEHLPAVRTYLDAFLGPSETESAVHEAIDEARYWGGDTLEELLRAAHRSLCARTDLDPAYEAAVIVMVSDLDATVAAWITGADEVRVRHEVHAAAALLRPEADLHGDRAARASQERLLRVGIAVLLVVALASLIGLLALR